MKVALLNSDSKSTYQVFEDIIDVDGKDVRVRYELRYLDKVEKWFLSMFDVETGKSYFRYVPVIASYEDDNNLIAPFEYKGMSIVICVPAIDEPKSVNPVKEDFEQFFLVWSDWDVE